MKIGITGIGLWGQGITSWSEFTAGLNGAFDLSAEPPATPSPANIPARERRRAPLTVKLAAEVINQAATMANTNQAELCSVFSSAVGDSNMTDYICRTLSGPDKTMSPTKFHNSVHNTTSGYWSISAENRLPSTFISAYDHSFPMALLEAASVSLTEHRPTVIVIYDVAFGAPISNVYPITETFAAAIIVDSVNSPMRTLDMEVHTGSASKPTAQNDYLQQRTKNNPSADTLILCEALAASTTGKLYWPISRSQPKAGYLAISIT
jgi:hypothetical protein